MIAHKTLTWMGMAAMLTYGCACGAPPENTRISILAPVAQRLECADSTALAEMTAILKIAGHDDCILDVLVDPLRIEGACTKVAVGIVRPLMLVYLSGPHEGISALPLALALGSVDLREEALSGTTSLTVEFTEQSTLTTQGEIDALPTEFVEEASETERARFWAREIIEAEGYSLDLDDDTCSNIAELCRGTLFTHVLASCP